MQAMTEPKKPHYGLHQQHSALGLGCLLASLFYLGSALGQEESTTYVSPREPANEYLDAIDRIEAENGPYTTELSDLYLGLGQTLMKSGDFDEARDAFHRGVMVVRVNSGPNSPEQTNHLYLLANYYPDDSPEMLPVLQRMYSWYSATRPPGSLDSDYEDYEKVIELTEEMARVSEAANGPNHPDTAVAYRRLADAEFQMVRHMTGVGMTLSPEIYVVATSGSLFPAGFGSESVVDHFYAGRKAFKKYLEAMLANASTSPLDYAEALAALGDWYMLFEKPRRSQEYYELGYRFLAQNENLAELADSYMSHPEPMHFIHPQPDFQEIIPEELRETSLDISMTVTSFGGVRNVEVLNAPESISDDFLREIKNRVRKTPFRPAIKGGEVITTKDFIWQYAIIPQGKAS